MFHRVRNWLDPRKDLITAATLDELPLDRIDKVRFYKRDEIAADLICCDVEIGGRTFFFHEEAKAGTCSSAIWKGFRLPPRLARARHREALRPLRDLGLPARWV